MTRPLHPDGRVHGVIVACSRADGRWLLIRRSANVAAPGAICFPGGGLELGEAQESAAAREMREELNADVRPIRRVWHFEVPERPLTLWGWLGELVSDHIAPNPDEVAEAMWLTAEEAASHPDALRHTDRFVEAILQAIHREQ